MQTGVLQSMGSQRVGYDLVTEQQQQQKKDKYKIIISIDAEKNGKGHYPFMIKFPNKAGIEGKYTK